MFESVEAWIGFVLILMSLSFLSSLIVIWIGGKLYKGKTIIFKSVFLSALTTTLVLYLCTIVASAIPFIGPIPGFFVGLFLTLFVLRGTFKESIKNIIPLWAVMIITQIMIVWICAQFFIGSLHDLISII